MGKKKGNKGKPQTEASEQGPSSSQQQRQQGVPASQPPTPQPVQEGHRGQQGQQQREATPQHENVYQRGGGRGRGGRGDGGGQGRGSYTQQQQQMGEMQYQERIPQQSERGRGRSPFTQHPGQQQQQKEQQQQQRGPQQQQRGQQQQQRGQQQQQREQQQQQMGQQQQQRGQQQQQRSDWREQGPRGFPPPQQDSPPAHQQGQGFTQESPTHQRGPWERPGPQPQQRPGGPHLSQTPVQAPSAWSQQMPRQVQPPPGLPQQTPSQMQPQHSQKTIPPQQKPQQSDQQQRGQGKGKHPKQQQPPTQAASAQQPPTAEMSKIRISESQKGQGELIPIQYIKAKPGTQGRKIIVETNHLALKLGALKTAIHYDVNLTPDTPKKYLREVLEIFRRKHYNNRYPAFDGRKNLYSSSMLPFGAFIEDEIIIHEADGREKKYKVEIKFANNVDLTPLQDLLSHEATPREAMQVVDIVLRSAPALTCVSVGRSFFVKPPTIIDLGEGMEMYNGFYQSVIRGWKPFLNVDVAHKAFPKNEKVIDILPELFDSYYQPFKVENLSQPLSRMHQDTLNTFIKTLRVCYEIPNQAATRRLYRVNGIDDPPITKTFKLDSGEVLTIAAYFEKHKNFRLRYPHLPSLWVGAQQRENKILLPVELCTLVQDQVLNRRMTENQTSKMIRYAATSTDVRKQKIFHGLRQANHNVHPSVKEFGFSIGNEFEKLEARVLQPPAIEYSGQKTVKPSRGVWRGDRFWRGAIINKWTIACVDRRPARPNDLANLADMVRKVTDASRESTFPASWESKIFSNAGPSGMSITSPAEKPFPHISGHQSIQDIRKYFELQKGKGYDVIFVVVPNSGPQYSYVKTAAEINVGCLTQCIKIKTLSRMNPQTAINILLKVNSKLNGINHCLPLTHRPKIMNKPCMIMGADVTHPSPDATHIPSVAAVTASHDPKAFRYNICWRLQPPRVEIIEDLEKIVIEQLLYFREQTKVKPERIVFFRDGVSEGQFEQVRTAEIRAIRSACKKLQSDGYEPSITFLVVQKRHHTRLFPTNKKDSEDKNNNVPAGTCVDTTITHPFMQDFYLVSHASIQGVAKPTKYCTLWDDNSMTNDDIEELTYYLCHMFSRCNRSVSYPAPTYYAHLAAARAKVYIENERLNMDNLQREFTRFQIQDAIRKGLPMFFV